MIPRLRVLVPLALSALVCFAGTAAAQKLTQPTLPPGLPQGPPAQSGSSPSHKQVHAEPLDLATAERRLGERLGHSQEMKQYDSVLEKLLKNLNANDFDKLSPDEIAKLQEIANQHNKGQPPDFNDPNYARILEKVKGFKQGDLKPDDLKALEKIGQQQADGKPLNLNDPEVAKLVQKMFDSKKKELSKEPDLDDKKLDDLWQKFGPKFDAKGKVITSPIDGHTGSPVGDPPDNHSQPKTNLNGGGSTSTASTPPVPPGPPPGSKGSQPPAWLSRQLLKIADSIDLDDSDKDSLAKLLKDVAKSGNDSSKAPDVGNLPNVGEYVPTDTINSAGTFFGNMKMPSLPSFGSVDPPTPQLSGGGGAGGAEGAFNVAIGVLALVLVGLVAWKLLSVYKDNQTALDDDPLRLGGWPVQPSAVRTRADLVKAFEYLAVLCLGAEARTHNHLELAEELGHQTPNDDARRTAAAQSLARLYEIARYTPADEALPPDELAAARRELSFLAGAASA